MADIVNGGITYSMGTIYGSTVYYACDNGYEVTGVASRVCLATGSWSDTQPVCTILGNKYKIYIESAGTHATGIRILAVIQ